ncbi:hypothetical protein M426DRAFT_142828 [Hypoxylon sp. CI-4A]|nr:hypothetical protein M426DRAFT_142828 [Hypoxylon sp. CI-4A]
MCLVIIFLPILLACQLPALKAASAFGCILAYLDLANHGACTIWSIHFLSIFFKDALGRRLERLSLQSGTSLLYSLIVE